MWALVQVCKYKRVKLWSTLYTNYHTLPLLNKQYFSPCFADGDTEAQEHSLMLQRRGTTSQEDRKISKSSAQSSTDIALKIYSVKHGLSSSSCYHFNLQCIFFSVTTLKGLLLKLLGVQCGGHVQYFTDPLQCRQEELNSAPLLLL